MALPTKIVLEVVTPQGLLLREEVDEVIAPGEDGYFGVRPGHTPFLSTLGLGEISYRRGGQWLHLTCFWGFCEVLPDRVNVLAEMGERPEDIDRAYELGANAYMVKPVSYRAVERLFESITHYWGLECAKPGLETLGQRH